MTKVARAAARRLPVPLRRVVRQFRVKRLIRRYRERIVCHSYGHGVALTISIQDPLAEYWYDRDDYDGWKELEEARAHGLGADANVFDIGAHQGVLALVLADIVGPSGRVVAVEANRHDARVAERNVILNGAAHVLVIHAACAASSGSITFEEGLNGHVAGGRLGIKRVRSVTVDQLADLYGAPDVVYLDVEGYEAQALEGSAKTLAAGATFVIEVHGSGRLQAAGGTVPEVVHRLRSHGYDLAFGGEHEVVAGRPLAPLTEAVLPVDERFFLLASRPRTSSR